MSAIIRVEAPAKINLHLRVYNLRPDGYHGISSLFQAVSLQDELVVRSLKEPDAVVIDGEFDCPMRETTLFKAVMQFRQATGIRKGVSIHVKKGIPAGAGLGGGSSDAAAALRALDAMTGTKLPLDRLVELAAKIGSDVPFFLSGTTAHVTGRGEIVRPIPSREGLYFTIVYPGFGVATKEAYALLDRSRKDDTQEPDLSPQCLEEEYLGNVGDWRFANSFEPFVAAAFPPISSYLSELRELGAGFVSMTGSGSSVFGVFRDSEAAQAAAIKLREKGLFACSVTPLAHLPSLR